MTEHEEEIQKPDFKDRKTGLVVFGIFEILIGALCVLIVFLVLIGMILLVVVDQPASASTSVQSMISGLLFYVLGAVWFVWMGIGSIKARRWARALLLVSSWVWIVVGIGALFFWLVFMPDIYGQMVASGRMSQEAALFMKYFVLIFLTCIYIILPGIFVLFYQSKHVKATCEARDSKIRWTDKCPLPVLALSFIFSFGVISMASMPSCNYAIPFFGYVLSGVAGAVAVLVIALVCVFLAWGIYKLKMSAWWTAVLLTVIGTISGIVTFSRMSMIEFYEKMNFPREQMEIIQQCNMPGSGAISLWMGLWAAVFLGYMLYVKKYFVSSSTHIEESNHE